MVWLLNLKLPIFGPLGVLGWLGSLTMADAAGSQEPGLSVAYDRGLPRKRMGAGVLFFDGSGRVLLVDPVYKPQWEIPGGVVEGGESPRDAAAP